MPQLPTFYSEVINHPNTTDDQRRETERKLLRYKQQYLHSVPNTKDHVDLKSRLREEVNELINGIVILKIPDEDAWMAYLNGIDHQTLSWPFFSLVVFLSDFSQQNRMTVVFWEPSQHCFQRLP